MSVLITWSLVSKEFLLLLLLLLSCVVLTDALLSPVIEQSIQADRQSSLPPLVIVTPETNIYRRIARAHTTPDESFMEIGCDYGITVDKIRKCMEDAGNVPVVWPVETDGTVDLQRNDEEDSKASCLGVDRSKESIGIANER